MRCREVNTTIAILDEIEYGKSQKTRNEKRVTFWGLVHILPYSIYWMMICLGARSPHVSQSSKFARKNAAYMLGFVFVASFPWANRQAETFPFDLVSSTDSLL